MRIVWTKFFLSCGTGILTGAILLTACSHSSKTPREPASSLASGASPTDVARESEEPLTRRESSRSRSYFDWPVDEARLTRGFFTRPQGKARRPHFGIDLAAPKGTRILAAHDGVVIYVGKDFRGFGRMILIEGRRGWSSLYAHLSEALVREGERVRQGDLIARMGRTGRATGVHLHFEIRKDKRPVDPLQYLPNGSRIPIPDLDQTTSGEEEAI